MGGDELNQSGAPAGLRVRKTCLPAHGKLSSVPLVKVEGE